MDLKQKIDARFSDPYRVSFKDLVGAIIVLSIVTMSWLLFFGKGNAVAIDKLSFLAEMVVGGMFLHESYRMYVDTKSNKRIEPTFEQSVENLEASSAPSENLEAYDTGSTLKK
jgi:hypothetical protein